MIILVIVIKFHLIGLPAQFFKFYLPPKNQSISSQITHSEIAGFICLFIRYI